MQLTLTPHHAKYFAHDLTRRATSGIDRLSMTLFDAAVDLNPHQIEASLFALQSPLFKGVILADEVGLGKTIEVGIVLCQLWAERRYRLLVICPASIRKQWALELEEKFNLPVQVLEASLHEDPLRVGRFGPHFSGPSAGATRPRCRRRFIPRIRQSIAWRTGRPTIRPSFDAAM